MEQMGIKVTSDARRRYTPWTEKVQSGRDSLVGEEGKESRDTVMKQVREKENFSMEGLVTFPSIARGTL